MTREECCDGDVLDMRLAVYRRTLETGNGDSGDLFCSFCPKEPLSYKRVSVYRIREYRDSILESAWTCFQDRS